MTISREEEVESLLSKVIDLQKKVIEEQSKEIEWLTHEYDSAHGIMVKKNQALREALSSLHNEVKGLIGIAESALRSIAGNTNVNCIQRRLEQAQAALQEES